MHTNCIIIFTLETGFCGGISERFKPLSFDSTPLELTLLESVLLLELTLDLLCTLFIPHTAIKVRTKEAIKEAAGMMRDDIPAHFQSFEITR